MPRGYSWAAARLARSIAIGLAIVGLSASGAAAVPSFAAQTGQPCNVCHVGGLGPQLTPFGRNFKMRGYTARTVSFNVPLAAFALASYVRTAKDQPPPPTRGFAVNDNLAVDQVSLFVAGGLGSHLGAFIQNTYDGVARSFHWDNLDVRAVTTASAKGADMVFGLDINNNPTVQDPFNTLQAWGFPYTTSALAPQPGAGPLIGALAQNTLGLSAYTWINSRLYAEVGAYRSLGAGVLTHFGVDPTSPGKINGFAPYARLAYQKVNGGRNFEVGAFWLNANLFPGRDQSTGLADGYTDLGLDGSYQYFAPNKDVFTVNGRYTYERQRPDASRALGLATNPTDTLQDLRADASYYWRNKIGLSGQVFHTWGSRDDLLYAGDRALRPDTTGLTLQLDGTPYGAGDSPLGKRFNLRLGVQYTHYFQFDGDRRNFDNFGRNAGDNDTARVFAWVYY